MRKDRSRAESGSGLVMILIVITMLLGFAAALTMVSTHGVRTMDQSERQMRAFYLADTGAQIGIARVRASNGSLAPTSFLETIDLKQASIEISLPSPDLYRIRSTGACGDAQKTVEVHIRYTGAFSVDGGVSTTFSSGAEVHGMPFHVHGGCMISGRDHSETGAVLADQSLAVYGLATNPVPGRKDFTITGSGLVEGSPAPTTNGASPEESILSALRNNAKDNADVRIFGSKTLGSGDAGAYGTAAAPKLVYASLGDENTLELGGSFTGHGTLVVEVDSAESETALKLKDLASWYGLVLVYCRGEAEVEGGALIEMSDSSRIVGGLTIFFNTEEMEIEGSGKLLRLLGGSSILYSSQLIAGARGTEILVEKSAEVISYRLQ